jgi:hypothetical protein
MDWGECHVAESSIRNVDRTLTSVDIAVSQRTTHRRNITTGYAIRAQTISLVAHISSLLKRTLTPRKNSHTPSKLGWPTNMNPTVSLGTHKNLHSLKFANRKIAD